VVATAIVARTLSRTVVNEGEEIGGELPRFGQELVFRDADHAVPASPESPIPPAVLAEGPLRAVGLEAVELADQFRFGPEAVDLEAVVVEGDPGVEARPGDPVGIEEGKEGFLEVAADAATGIVGLPFESDADDRRAFVAWVALEEGRERDRAIDPEVFHLPERALRRRGAFCCCEVEDGSGPRKWSGCRRGPFARRREAPRSGGGWTVASTSFAARSHASPPLPIPRSPKAPPQFGG
jgi:hypothetical protein